MKDPSNLFGAIWVLVLLFGSLSLTPPLLQAQSSDGTLVGTVTDQSDAAIPNATVKVISSQYGSSRENPADKIPLLEQWVTMQRTQTILRGHRTGLAYLRALLEKAEDRDGQRWLHLRTNSWCDSLRIRFWGLFVRTSVYARRSAGSDTRKWTLWSRG